MPKDDGLRRRRVMYERHLAQLESAFQRPERCLLRARHREDIELNQAGRTLRAVDIREVCYYCTV